MADEKPSTNGKTLEQRVTELENAVVSLGAPQITHRHDKFKAFTDWLSARGIKARGAKAEPDPKHDPGFSPPPKAAATA